jgi:CBS domain containing-hemolysin-like protein
MNTATIFSFADLYAANLIGFLDSTPHDAAEADGGGYGFYFLMLGLALLLVVLNGFFVAAEFALVKIRPSQIEKLVEEKRLFAGSAKWLFDRMDHTLSACQLGITMASLGLGWVGEPAFAKLLEPVFKLLNIGPSVGHIIAFLVAFSMITALHLVVGEQAPKIFAIREPVKMLMWCAAPMRFFYYLLFPFMWVLNWVTNWILAKIGLTGETGHGAPHNEEEIRAMLSESHTHGFLSRIEHRLMNAVMEFDDMLCRLVMVPRREVQAMDVNKPFSELMEMAKQTRHTRYPVVDASLDSVLGVVHMKDLVGISESADFDIRSVMRPPTKVPESMPISQVLRHFQSTHQLMSFVVDEYGTIIGIVTMENVLEKIIGPVDDEFDVADDPKIKKLLNGEFVVLGSTHIAEVEDALGLNLDDEDADTVAGVLMSRLGKIPEQDDKFEFDGAVAHVLAVKNDRAEKIRFVITAPTPADKGKASKH